MLSLKAITLTAAAAILLTFLVVVPATPQAPPPAPIGPSGARACIAQFRTATVSGTRLGQVALLAGIPVAGPGKAPRGGLKGLTGAGWRAQSGGL